MTTMEILEMTAKFAATLAAIFAAVALVINACGMRLQRRSLRANLFNDIRRRINELEDKHADIKKGQTRKLESWYYRIFSVWESFAFYANRGYLEKDMAEFYTTGIEYYVKRLERFPRLFNHFKEREAGEFCELEKYYKKFIGKNLPF